MNPKHDELDKKEIDRIWRREKLIQPKREKNFQNHFQRFLLIVKRAERMLSRTKKAKPTVFKAPAANEIE